MSGDGWHEDRPKEECGVIGLFSPGSEASRLAFFSLYALQHRGQESAGIAVSDGSQVHTELGLGLVGQIFDESVLARLPGHMAVGHTRYSTTGGSELRNAQPIQCTSVVGEIAVAHNGNLINSRELRAELIAEGEVFNATTDSEIIARLIVRNLHLGPENAVAATMRRIEGAYAVAVLTPDRLLAFRDPNGIRPLVAGEVGDGWMVASETCAFWPVGGVPRRQVGPGEVVIIDGRGMRFAQAVPSQREARCLFEFIYFARPDSRMYGTSLYRARERMGERLAQEQPADADIVVPVPDSGIPAALGFSRVTGIPYHEAMIKNRYIHRTFIQPDQRMRELGVQMKLAPMIEEIEGRSLVLVDDSIVRATTTRQIVKLLRDCGARSIHVRITAPPIRHPCFYGIDMSSRGELAAAAMTIDEIACHIGADSLGYLTIEGACEAVGQPMSAFCLACFNGNYPVPVPDGLSKDALVPDVGQLSTLGPRAG
ncbi:MAG: amidophosphoribosyltransferase [Fimbriimonadaceae bacterium]|nr:amidophosphoribosyltransferase [Fimbriimonadaceae bacterium]QYK59633.1 MAG: amidophosphoribosyltransferase [Fimbriimonadaceae bacterium]